MRRSLFIAPRLVLAGFAALALAACNDRGDPLNVPGPQPVPPSPPVMVASVRCTASPQARSLSCGGADLPASARGYIIVGGQDQYVHLGSANVAYNSGTHVFSFDATVENLIPQPMGTADGATADSGGVKVFFSSGPTVTAGTGTAGVTGDGSGTFTASGQPFYKYAGGLLGGDGILSQNETSGARSWQITVDPTVVTFSFLVYVVAEVPHPNGYVDVTPAADSLAAGSSQPFSATVRSAVGNPIAGQTVTWGTSDAGLATVDGAGNVTAVAPGTVTITATSGARSGSATVAVCPSLAVGGAYVADMPGGSGLCLAGGTAGAEYVAVPVNTSDAAAVALSVTGSGIVPVSGPPTPTRLPAGPRLSRFAWARPEDFGARLRARDRGQVNRLIPDARQRWRSGGVAAMRGAAAGGVRAAITPGVPSVGALMSLNVETDNSCSTLDTRTGRVVAVGTRLIVIADTLNPAGGLGTADYQAMADSFDAFIYPVATANFDVPSDIDGNGGRVVAFFTRAVNELTPGGSPLDGGFFLSRDLLPATTCPTSNVGEMVYLAAADPSGTVNGNVRSVSAVKEAAQRTLAHELEPMINAGRRMYVNSAPDLEEPWLDEGLARVSTELVFYDRSGTGPGANLGVAEVAASVAVQDAFFRYMDDTFGHLRAWLLSPNANGGFQLDADSATAGAAWAFLRYSADRKGGTQSATWHALVNSTTVGLANLQSVLGTDPLPWYRDFAGAMYADDAGLSPAAAYTQPSWNFRSLYANLDYDPGPACSCAYELAVRNPANGVADSFTLADGGGAAYLRLGVPANAFAGVRTLSGGVAPPATVRMLVIRRK